MSRQINNGEFVERLLKHTCLYKDPNMWYTNVVNDSADNISVKNIRDNEKYYSVTGQRKHNLIITTLEPMQQIYYGFCEVRRIMIQTLSNYSIEQFRQYIIKNQTMQPDENLKNIMISLFCNSSLGQTGRGMLSNYKRISLDRNFNITQHADLNDTTVEKMRVNFFYNVWEFIANFNSELKYTGTIDTLDIQNIMSKYARHNSYVFPIFEVGDYATHSPNYLKQIMEDIRSYAEPTVGNQSNNYDSDITLQEDYKEDLLTCSTLYYGSLKQIVNDLEIDLSEILEEYADEIEDDNTKSTKPLGKTKGPPPGAKPSVDSRERQRKIENRYKHGGSKTKRKQRRRKQKSKRKRN